MRPSWVFLPLVPFYAFVTVVRNWFFEIELFQSIDVGIPVISVGNITTGGTGKTPIVKNIALILSENKNHVAIVSRGYGRSSSGTVVVSDGKNILCDMDSSGDEPLLLAEQLQNVIVIVDEDRVRGSKKAITEFGATVIVLDDGFQHRYLKRSKDIVLIDSEHVPSETMLLPAGHRRELLSSLNRADAILFTKITSVNEVEKVSTGIQLNSAQKIFSSSFQPSGIHHLFGGVNQSLEMVNGKKAVVFCGIAKPENFRLSLESCGVHVQKYFNFPDHYSFTHEDIKELLHAFHAANADYIITTEKDAVRLKEFEIQLTTLPIVVLTMEVVLHQQESWKQYILDGLIS